MAPVPPNTTARLKVHYTGPFGQHTMLFHGVTGQSDATMVTAARAVVTVMATFQWDGTSWDSAEFAEAGSNLFFPTSWGSPIVSASGLDPIASSSPAYMVSFVGRGGANGRRARLFLFEGAGAYTPNQRYTSGESTQVDNIVAALIAANSVLGSIDGDVVAWKPYGNTGQNDHIVRKARAT